MNERLTILLSFLGISQKVFAKELCIAPSTVNQWLNGKRAPSQAMLKLISIRYNVSMQWLISGKGEMMVADDYNLLVERVSDGSSTKKRVFNTLQKLSDNDWKVVEKIIDGFGLGKQSDDC